MNGNPWEEGSKPTEPASPRGTGAGGPAGPPDPAAGTGISGAGHGASPLGEAGATGPALKLGQRVWGPILRMTEDQAVVSLSEEGIVEGTLDLVHLRDEFGNLSVAEGDEVQAFIVRLDPSIQLAPTLDPPAGEVLRRLREAQDRNETVRGRVTGVNRGGLEIYIDGRRAFCPYSQIEIGRCENAEIYLNRLLDFVVTEIDEEKRRVILSRRPILEKERRAKLGDLREQIRAGIEFDGVVRRVQPFGAFVDIGGIEGLVHVSEISHDRVENAGQALHPGEKVRVKVLEVTREKDGQERIRLSIRATMLDPWTKAADLFHEGDILTGKVVRVTDFGAFVKLHPGIEGLLHVSQYQPRAPRGQRTAGEGTSVEPPSAAQTAPENAAAEAPAISPATADAAGEIPGTEDRAPVAGEEITVRISRIELDRKRISLALRNEEQRPERGFDHDGVIGETVEGVVRSVKRFGIFLDLPSLGPWVSGLLPAAETGLGREVNLARKFRMGDKVQVEIIEIDDRGRIRLSQKRAAEAEEKTSAAPAAAEAQKAATPPTLGIFAQALKRAEEKYQRKAQAGPGTGAEGEQH